MCPRLSPGIIKYAIEMIEQSENTGLLDQSGHNLPTLGHDNPRRFIFLERVLREILSAWADLLLFQ